MAQVTRLKIAQQGGGTKEVAFTDDIKLTALQQGNLIIVDTTDGTATVKVDDTKLSLNTTAGNVKVNTPLELAVETVIPADDGKLHAVDTSTGVKLYWGSSVIEAHDPEEDFVTEKDFQAHSTNETPAKHLSADQLALVAAVPTTGKIATEDKVNDIVEAALTPVEQSVEELQGAVADLESVTDGYTGEGAIKTAVDAAQGTANAAQTAATAAQTTADTAVAAAAAADAKAQGAVDVIGVWTTISDKTVKAAIEENKAEILALKGNHFIVVGTLPATGEPNCIYLVPKDGSETGNVKEEWIYVNNDWEKIGDTAVDLSEYAKTTEVQTIVTSAVAVETAARESADTALGNRVTALETSSGTAATDIAALKNVTSGYTETGSIKTAVDAAAATAATAVQTVTGDANIDASKSGTTVTVGVKVNSDLAKLLAACTLTTKEE